jgi:hypothetical protein
VGAHVHRVAIGQRSDLTDTMPRASETGATDSAFRFAFLTLLAFDGILSAIGGALLLPSYIGAIPFPISALISGLLNAALVWAALRWTTSIRLAALPLWTWLATVLAMCWPGNGLILSGRGFLAYSPLLLLVVGAGPPFWLLLRRRTAP